MTVAELRERLTGDELSRWVAYAREIGPLNLAWRVDYAIARAVAVYTGGGSELLKKLMPYPNEEEREATPEDIMAILSKAKIEKPIEVVHVVETPPADASPAAESASG